MLTAKHAVLRRATFATFWISLIAALGIFLAGSDVVEATTQYISCGVGSPCKGQTNKYTSSGIYWAYGVAAEAPGSEPFYTSADIRGTNWWHWGTVFEDSFCATWSNTACNTGTIAMCNQDDPFGPPFGCGTGSYANNLHYATTWSWWQDNDWTVYQTFTATTSTFQRQTWGCWDGMNCLYNNP